VFQSTLAALFLTGVHRRFAIRAFFAVVFALAVSPLRARSAEPTETIPLWPNGAPGATGDEPKDRPQCLVYLPPQAKASGSAIVICPGGGYGGLAMGHEGHAMAEWFNGLGMAAIIVDYRHRGKGYGHPAPMLDAQRALRLARSRAQPWRFRPDHIGVIGFSAGGHLASTVATHFDAGDPRAEDPVERVSSRPDFAILSYAVIAFDQPYTHRGSQRNLIGEQPAAELIASLSNERQVSDQTPPTFLWHTDEDKVVPSENSVMFYLALRRHRVPAELHIFRKGRHGLGLAEGHRGTELWTQACKAWLQNIGMLE